MNERQRLAAYRGGAASIEDEHAAGRISGAERACRLADLRDAMQITARREQPVEAYVKAAERAERVLRHIAARRERIRARRHAA